MQRTIPGFYYDVQKQKYFRIQRNHVVPNSSTAYTQQSVKTLIHQQQLIGRQQKRERKARQSHVQRSPLASNLSYKLLECRFRGRRSMTGLLSHLFASQITSRPAYGSASDQAFPPRRFPRRTFYISQDGFTTTTFFNSQQHLGRDRPTDSDDPESFIYNVSDTMTHQHSNGSAPISTGVGIIAGPQLANPNSVIACDIGVEITCFDLLRSQVQSVQRVLQAMCIWDLAVSPWTGHIAAATTDGLLLSRLDSGLSTPPIATGPAKDREQMNVMFKDRNIICSGERSGSVNFCDVRSRDSVMRLKHSSAVLGAHSTKHPEQLIVHGFSTTCIYDLRYSKAVSPSPSQPHGRAPKNTAGQHPRHRRRAPSTQPYIKLSVPPNRRTTHYSNGHKLAYSAELDLVIAASSTLSDPTPISSNHVSLYSATTGRFLPGPLSNHHFNHEVTCLDIKRLRDGPESIVLLSNEIIQEWTMHHSRNDDDFYNHRRSDGSMRLAASSGSVADFGGPSSTAAGRNLIVDAVDFSDRSRYPLPTFASRWNQGNLGPLGLG